MSAERAYPNLTLLEVPVPSSIDAPEAWAIHSIADIDREDDLARLGHNDLSWSAEQWLAELRSQKYARKIYVVALAEPSDAGQPARVLGAMRIFLPLQDNTHRARVAVAVRAAHRRRGVGAALAEKSVEVARANGRRVLVGESFSTTEPPQDSADALVAPTGAGRVDRTGLGASFALRSGYALEQTERHSVLQIPIADNVIDRWREAAWAKAGSDYGVVQWIGAAPADRVEGLAELNSRMSTDMPHAGLDTEEQSWDVARVRAMEAEYAEGGSTVYVTAIEHVPSGRLVAYSALVASSNTPESLGQSNTLVLKEHRGHSLGLLAKAENLALAQREEPAARRIHTWNAGENQHMLAINTHMGFTRASTFAMWQRRLS